jgi:hypothetical protein
VQIAKVQSTFRARLPGGPVAPKSLIRTENDSAGHNNNLDASKFVAASPLSLAGRIAGASRLHSPTVLYQDLMVWPAKARLIILKVMRKGDRTMSSGTMRLLESMDHSAVKEYRINDGFADILRRV